MAYRIVKPLEGHRCPECGSMAYIEESDDLGDVRYCVWCSNPDCSRASVARYSRVRGKAVRDFLKEPKPSRGERQ